MLGRSFQSRFRSQEPLVDLHSSRHFLLANSFNVFSDESSSSCFHVNALFMSKVYNFLWALPAFMSTNAFAPAHVSNRKLEIVFFHFNFIFVCWLKELFWWCTIIGRLFTYLCIEFILKLFPLNFISGALFQCLWRHQFYNKKILAKYI